MDEQTAVSAAAIELGGRKFSFVSQSLTAAQDDYILGHLRRCGAVEALRREDLSDEQRAEELLTRVMIAGETFAVLAGTLVEEGKRWTRADAERNARQFGEITDPGEKVAMRDMLVGYVIGFFDFARRFAATSRKSSSPTVEDPSTKSADPATSETSRPSSEASPEATQSASAR